MKPNLVLCELGPTGIDAAESFSPFCLKVHRALKAARLHYLSLHADDPAEFKDLNPAGQVPVLLVDDVPFSDSPKILKKIDELAPGRISPTDPKLRAEAALWQALADTTLNGYLAAARWADDRNWGAVKLAFFGHMPALVRAMVAPSVRRKMIAKLEARDVTRHGLAVTWRKFEELLDSLELRAPANGFWVGDMLSFADFALYGQLAALRTPLTLWQSAKIAERPRLSAYLDRVDGATRESRAFQPAFVPTRTVLQPATTPLF
ncbi:MAG TPA: glutathione S-transferase family protein [Polyangiaceae bacterium]